MAGLKTFATLIPFNTKEFEDHSLTDEEALPSHPLQGGRRW